MINLCVTTIVSLFAFLIFNWNPAKIFMGDSGSLFLGFTISVVAVLSLKYVHPIAILYLAALPIVDTLIVMVRKNLSPFRPDKTHIHHILLNFFQKKVKKTVSFLILLQIIFSLIGLMFVGDSKVLPFGLGFLSLIVFISINMIFYMIFTGMKRRQKLTLRKKRLNNPKNV